MKSYNYGVDYSIKLRKVEYRDMDMLSEFKCEKPSIRKFIQRGCLTSRENVSYIFLDEENNAIIGFCSIRCGGISTIKYDEEDNEYVTSLPSVEITYFAIDERYRSLRFDKESNKYQTLSQILFLKMLEIISDISTNNIGATHICLYSVPEAENFYKRCNFESFKNYMKRDEKPYIKDCVPMFTILKK